MMNLIYYTPYLYFMNISSKYFERSQLTLHFLLNDIGSDDIVKEVEDVVYEVNDIAQELEALI